MFNRPLHLAVGHAALHGREFFAVEIEPRSRGTGRCEGSVDNGSARLALRVVMFLVSVFGKLGLLALRDARALGGLFAGRA